MNRFVSFSPSTSHLPAIVRREQACVFGDFQIDNCHASQGSRMNAMRLPCHASILNDEPPRSVRNCAAFIFRFLQRFSPDQYPS